MTKKKVETGIFDKKIIENSPVFKKLKEVGREPLLDSEGRPITGINIVDLEIVEEEEQPNTPPTA